MVPRGCIIPDFCVFCEKNPVEKPISILCLDANSKPSAIVACEGGILPQSQCVMCTTVVLKMC